MSLSFIKFIKSESGVCLLLAIGCVIFAFLLILLIIRDRKTKHEDYTKLNIEKEINATSQETKKAEKEEKEVETKTEIVKEDTKKEKVVKAKETKKVEEEKVEKEKVEKEEVEKEPEEVAEVEEVKEEIKKKPAKTANYHVSKHQSGKWQVKKAGGTKAIKLFDTQAEAISFAKEKSEKQDNNVVIHKKNGQIRKQDYSK